MDLQREFDKLRKKYESASNAGTVLAVLLFIAIFGTIAVVLEGVPIVVLVIIFVAMIFIWAFLSNKFNNKNHKLFKFMEQNIIQPSVNAAGLEIEGCQTANKESLYVRTPVLGSAEETMSTKLIFKWGEDMATLYSDKYVQTEGTEYHTYQYTAYQSAVVLKSRRKDMNGIVRFVWKKDDATGEYTFFNEYQSKVQLDPNLEGYVKKLISIVEPEGYNCVYLDFCSGQVTIGFVEDNACKKGHLTMYPERKDAGNISVLCDYMRNDMIFAKQYLDVIREMHEMGII